MIYPKLLFILSDLILQNIEKIQLVDCPVLVIHVSVFSHYIIDSYLIYII